jgi:hypothetical protein
VAEISNIRMHDVDIAVERFGRKNARWEAVKTSRVQGVGGITGIAIALSIIGGAVYGVIKLVDLVTDDAGAGSPEP